MNNYNIYICGVGGQGIIKTSVVIGEAAMNEGYEVSMSEIHGMSQRGGSVSTELRIGDYKSSIVENNKADMLLGFEPAEIVRGLHKANKNTKIVFNTTPIIPSTIAKTGERYPSVTEEIIPKLKKEYTNVHPIDGNKLAEDAGSILSLNMVLLGALTADEEFILSKDSIIEAMKDNLKPKFHEMNIKAIENGYNAVKKLGE